MRAMGHDIKGLTKSVFALASTAATAGSTGDDTTIDGAVIDTTEIKAESAVFEIPCKGVLAADETLTVTAAVLHSDSSNTGFTEVVPAAAVLELGDTVGGTFYGVARVGVDLSKTKRYVYVTALPVLSRDGTDTAVIGGGVAVLGGVQELP